MFIEDLHWLRKVLSCFDPGVGVGGGRGGVLSEKIGGRVRPASKTLY